MYIVYQLFYQIFHSFDGLMERPLQNFAAGILKRNLLKYYNITGNLPEHYA